MQKRTIVFLAIIMALSFAGVCLLQCHYLDTLLELREDNFNSGVKRSLFIVARRLEDRETLEYLNRSLNEEQEARDAARPMALPGQLPAYTPAGPRDLTAPAQGSVQQVANSLQRQLHDNFTRKRLLMQMAFAWMHDTPSAAVTDRVETGALGEMLTCELMRNGINTPFYFTVVDNAGSQVLSSLGDNGITLEGDDYYTQPLFESDLHNSPCALRVYFPEKNRVIWSKVSSMAVTALVMTLLLLVTFITTLALMIRQRKLAQSKTDFMNNMTHELKTPISTISLAAQILADGDMNKTPETLTRLARVIRDETKRLSFQVEKVLQISLLENEKASLKFKEMDVNEIITGVVESFNIKVKSKGGAIETDLRADEPMAMVDELHFTNILFNLMDNAVKYSKEDVPPVLRVSTWNEGDNLLVAVEDNGIGIKKEYLKRVFDKFQRVPTGNVHNVKGFGLGLAYVKQMVTKHKGHVRAESEFGKGTRFIIDIPIIKKQ